MWLGECIANWTGIKTEGRKTKPPFYTDSDWSDIGFILNQDPWLADDDTDIEYVYLHLLDQHSLTTLTQNLIRSGWMKHISRMIWVSNARVRGMFDRGILPPATSLLNANELAIQIDAQLTTEFFGALAPGMPQKALQMANLPILTTANSHAAHASQFHVILYSLAGIVDTSLSGRDQALWLVDEARKYIPNTSKAADIIGFVRADFIANPDVNDWESTRDKIYDHYHLNASDNGFRYADWTESSVNFGTSVMCLLYGEMNYRRTVQIGTLAGWDSDNPTATMGGLLGLIYGYERLVAEFPEVTSFSDRYNIYRTRDALPDYFPDDPGAEDTFTMMANRMLHIIDLAVQEAGGSVQENTWILPLTDEASVELNPLYELMQHSANNRVRAEGGIVTAQSSVGGSSIEAFADGFEHNFNGEEWFGIAPEYLSDNTDTATLTVVYDRSVQVHTVRLIEGSDSHGFTSASVEVYQNDSWVSQSGSMLQSVPLDANQELQIVDFGFNTPLEAMGIRIKGPVNGRLNILELDALSEPLSVSGNIPPTISIISPKVGELFYVPANITINVDACDNDGDITKVEFYNGFTKLGEDTSSPYNFTWYNLSAGVYSLTAKATDDDSAISISSPVWILVRESGSKKSIWHSYDVVTISDFQPVVVLDQESNTLAAIELYESTNAGGVDRGYLFSTFNEDGHLEDFNHVEYFWANTRGFQAYPYAGKSTIDRGSDSGESNTPEPSGVYDLQLHPPDNDHLTIATFMAPFDGTYSISDLAVRRVHDQGGTVTYKVFSSSKDVVASLEASNNRVWVVDENKYNLGTMMAGERVYFAVDRGEGDNFYWDAAEITWTVTFGEDGGTTRQGNSLPYDFALKQNYPNPFNAHTVIKYELPSTSNISLKVYDVFGQEVYRLAEGLLPAGFKTVVWDGRDGLGKTVGSGIYFVRLETKGFMYTRKMILLR